MNSPFWGGTQGPTQEVLTLDDNAVSGPNNGFYTPSVVTVPSIGGDSYLLTGDLGGTIYSYEINSFNEVSNESVFISPSDIGVSTLRGYKALWDNKNGELVTFVAGGSGRPFSLYAVSVSKTSNGWNVTDYSELVSSRLYEHATAVAVGGGAVFGGTLDDSGDVGDLQIWGMTDLTQRPLPSSPDAGGTTLMYATENDIDPVNYQFVQISPTLMAILYEGGGVGDWSTRIAYSIMPGKFLASSGVALTAEGANPLQLNGTSGNDNWTHAHFTTELGRPQIFMQRLTGVGQGNISSAIHVYEPDSDLFRPTEQFPLRGRAMAFTTSGRFFPMFDAKNIDCFIKDDTGATITLEESMRADGSNSVDNTGSALSAVDSDSFTVTGSYAAINTDSSVYQTDVRLTK